MIKRVVLSGGPGTGKTSIVNILEQQGFNVFHEVSREIIQEEVAKNSGIVPWDNLFAFSEKVLSERKVHYDLAKDLCFYDRSIIDTIAYLIKDNDRVLEEWHEMAKNNKYYNLVFITPPWQEIYNNDGERKESFKTLLALHDALCKTYQHYGYTIVEIPKLSIHDRANFILKTLQIN